jgi:hypothetical protein
MAGANVAAVRKLALALPGVSEGTSYGTVAFRVSKLLIARLRDEDQVLALRCDFDERDSLIDADPDVYFTTDHYRDGQWVLVRLKRVSRVDLAEAIEAAWRLRASSRLLREFDAVD